MRLHEKYNTQVRELLQTEFNYSSSMEIPRIEKIILNMTAGREVTNTKAIEEVLNELSIISSQKPYETVAKKSLAS